MRSLLEQDGDLINHWYVIALSHEVGTEKPVSRQIYEKHYVLFRGADQKISVLEDRCLHRGAQLSKGNCYKGELRCPYHGWKYNQKGQVVEVPSEGTSADIHSKNWQAPSLTAIEQDNCIWVWTGTKEKMTSLPPWRFPHLQEKSWSQYFMITDFDDEVSRLVQNFMDVPHTVFVHSKWFRSRRFLKVPIEILARNGRVKVTYQQSKDSIGFIERILNPKGAPMIHTDEFIFPNITRVDYNFGEYSFIINSQCTPLSRYKTRVYTWITYKTGFLSFLLKPFFQFYTRQVIEQDVKIMNNLGENFQRNEHLPEMTYKSTAADEFHLAIDRMRRIGIQDQRQITQIDFEKQREFWI